MHNNENQKPMHGADDGSLGDGLLTSRSGLSAVEDRQKTEKQLAVLEMRQLLDRFRKTQSKVLKRLQHAESTFSSRPSDIQQRTSMP